MAFFFLFPAARFLLCLLPYTGWKEGKLAEGSSSEDWNLACNCCWDASQYCLASSPLLSPLEQGKGRKEARRRGNRKLEGVFGFEERRVKDSDIETCPPADSGSFCEAVGGGGVSEGGGDSVSNWQALEPMGARLKNNLERGMRREDELSNWF